MLLTAQYPNPLRIILDYQVIVEAYEKIEATTKRLEMTDILVDLLKKTPADVISKVVYLTQGRLYPDFVGIEIGIAEKLAIRALARASGRRETEILGDLNKTGDIGETGKKFMSNKKQTTFSEDKLIVEKVYETLDKIARSSGSGAVEMKMSLLAGMLACASPLEAKYLTRTVTGKLRLGIADMTVLDALAIAYGGGKEARKWIERAYNISSDLGRAATVLVQQGLKGIKRFKVIIGEPIRPMLAERLSSSEEILEKFGGKCVAEYKYDGERIQAHKNGDKVTLFSRRLENITSQYPDIAKLVTAYVTVKDAVIEGEIVAVELDTGEMRPFQELMHRRRKYEIQKAIEEYPVSFFPFDALYADKNDLTFECYLKRREVLEKIVKQTERIKLTQSLRIDNVKELERFFLEAIEMGCEGLVCKSISDSSVYQAGARGWLWIKYKRDYKSEMIDTVDLVVIGGLYGRGRRAGTYGALLLASYNSHNDTFDSVTKCGSGFTDEDLDKIPEMLKNHIISNKHARVNSGLNADVWFEPSLVLEILGAEITLSPIHVCALDSVRRGSGLAIRFPRFTGKYRDDKSPEDATTCDEILSMYKSRLRRTENPSLEAQ